MTIILEIDGPFQWRPFTFRSDVMFRIGWLWFAVAVLRVSFPDFCKGPKVWVDATWKASQKVPT